MRHILSRYFHKVLDKLKNESFHRLVKGAIGDYPEQGEHPINLLLISRHLERIADHATNIAELVIYLIEGEIVRHGDLNC